MSDLVQDVLICGACNICYSNIADFVIHKQSCASNQNLPSSSNDENNQTCLSTVIPESTIQGGRLLLSFMGNEIQPISKDAVPVENQDVGIDDQNISNQTTAIHPNLVSSSQIEKSKPSGSKKAKKLLQCSEPGCNYKTYATYDMNRHSRTHTGEKPYTCKICDKGFCRSDKLNLHMRSHTKENLSRCEHCSYTCLDKATLKYHLRIHSGKKTFQCQICNYRGRTSGQLTTHLRTHTGDAPYSCQVCDAKFKTASDVKRHGSIHSDRKLFKCTSCDYACNFKSNLNSHEQRKHNKGIAKAKKPGSSTGGNGVTTIKDLSDVSSVQTKGNEDISTNNSPTISKACKRRETKKNSKFTCETCGDSFVRLDSLRCHLSYHSHQNKINKNDEAIVDVNDDVLSSLNKDGQAPDSIFSANIPTEESASDGANVLLSEGTHVDGAYSMSSSEMSITFMVPSPGAKQQMISLNEACYIPVSDITLDCLENPRS